MFTSKGLWIGRSPRAGRPQLTPWPSQARRPGAKPDEQTEDYCSTMICRWMYRWWMTWHKCEYFLYWTEFGFSNEQRLPRWQRNMTPRNDQCVQDAASNIPRRIWCTRFKYSQSQPCSLYPNVEQEVLGKCIAGGSRQRRNKSQMTQGWIPMSTAGGRSA